MYLSINRRSNSVQSFRYKAKICRLVMLCTVAIAVYNIAFKSTRRNNLIYWAGNYISKNRVSQIPAFLACRSRG